MAVFCNLLRVCQIMQAKRHFMNSFLMIPLLFSIYLKKHLTLQAVRESGNCFFSVQAVGNLPKEINKLHLKLSLLE